MTSVLCIADYQRRPKVCLLMVHQYELLLNMNLRQRLDLRPVTSCTQNPDQYRCTAHLSCKKCYHLHQEQLVQIVVSLWASRRIHDAICLSVCSTPTIIIVGSRSSSEDPLSGRCRSIQRPSVKLSFSLSLLPSLQRRPLCIIATKCHRLKQLRKQRNLCPPLITEAECTDTENPGSLRQAPPYRAIGAMV